MAKYYLVLLSLFFPFLLISQEGENVRNVEQRLLILEDFLKGQLKELRSEVKSNQKTIKQLQKQNAKLIRAYKSLRDKLDKAEAEVLRLDIALKNAKQGIPSEEIDGETSIAVEEPVEAPIKEVKASLKEFETDLNSPSPQIRLGALLRLSKIADPDREILLAKALEDSDRYVCLTACKILGEMKASNSVKNLVGLLKRPDLIIQKSAVKTLEQITGKNSDIDFSQDAVSLQNALDSFASEVLK